MEKYLPMITHTYLFAGVSDEEVRTMLGCLGARLRNYAKGEFVFRHGERMGDIMLLAEGALHIVHSDYWGNSNIISAVTAGELFGEAYIAPSSGVMMNDVVAIEPSAVVFFDARKLLHVCPSSCRFHSLVVQNLFYALCDKNRKLVRKLGHMSGRTTREKLMSYLSEQSRRHGSASFSIPFNRQQLADFLSVDRSAMSAELGRMRNDGLLTFEKNHFTLL